MLSLTAFTLNTDRYALYTSRDMEKHIIEEPLAGVNWRVVYNAKSKEFHDLVKAENFHTLDMEDCSHPRRLAKVVDRPEYMFIVVKMARHDAKAGHLTFENIDIFINAGTLVTVVENGSPMPERIVRRFADKTIKPSPLHIGYALLDEIVDEYLVMLDAVGEAVNALEGSVTKHPSSALLQRIFSAKRSLIDFRRNAAAMREVVNALLRQQSIEKDHELLNYFRDLYGHTIQVIEFIETYRELLTESTEIYLSSVANRTNDIVKVLTIYGTIAVPPVIITSFYGMNIRLPFQQFSGVVLPISIFMIACMIGILAYFRKKEWF